MTKLFVYGTLRRGQRNHRLIQDQRFLGEAKTKPLYRLLDLGQYPGLVPASPGQGQSIPGELYEVSQCAIAELDDFEGVPWLFDRQGIHLEMPTGCEPVFAYVYQGAQAPVSRSHSQA